MIKIICVGKIKEAFYRDAIEEYKKRIQKYSKIEIIEVPDFALEQPELNRQKEKEVILKYIKPREHIVTLEIEGKQYDSVSFANKIDHVFQNSSTITFIIGGSDGLANEIKSLSNNAISFSKMTFPHQLFRIILLEQIYRAFKINYNESYHK